MDGEKTAKKTATTSTREPVDLGRLRIDDAQATRGPQHPWWMRVAPLGVLAILTAAAATFLVPLLRPRIEVRTAAVRAAGDAPGAMRSAVTTEAAGWVEPDPFPVQVRPLVRGVVAELHVLEGDRVEAGKTVLARLEDAPFRLALAEAEADEAVREAEVEEARAVLDGAEAALRRNAGPRRSARDAEVHLAEADALLARCRADRTAAAAQRAARARELELLETLVAEGVSQEAALIRARADLAIAEAELEALGKREVALVRAREARAAAAAVEAETERDPVELKQAVATARAAVAGAEARLRQARAAGERARAELSWCEVRAPSDGVVMHVEAPPGAPAGPPGSESGGGAVVSLYDPASLQVRVDVPLGEVSRVRVGQTAEIASEVLGDRVVAGRVTRIRRESDLLKNTLQVKVRIEEQAPLLVPETLCRVRLLADPEAGGSTSGPTRFLVPTEAVRDGAVHVVDPRSGGRARRVAVELLGTRDGDSLVSGALSVTQRVILDPVRDGDAVEEVSR